MLIYSAAPLEAHATGSMTWYRTQSHYPDTEQTIPRPILVITSARLGSEKHHFCKLSILLEQDRNQHPPARWLSLQEAWGDLWIFGVMSVRCPPVTWLTADVTESLGPWMRTKCGGRFDGVKASLVSKFWPWRVIALLSIGRYGSGRRWLLISL